MNFTSDQEHIPKSKFDILPYPIELSDHKAFDRAKIKSDLGLSVNSFVVSSVARFVEQKGQTYFIKAIPQVLKELNRDDVYFLIVGYGKMEADLRILVDELGLNSRVIITPTRDIKEILAVSDVFVVSSLWEGQPIAMLEAMEALVPVVATSVGGIPEIIVDGQNGLLALPNDPGSLAQKMIEGLKNPELLKKISNEAKLVVQNYSLAVYIKKLEKFFLDTYENQN